MKLTSRRPTDPALSAEYVRFIDAMRTGKIGSFLVVAQYRDGSGAILCEGADSDPARLAELKPLVLEALPLVGLAVAGRVKMDAPALPPAPSA